MEKEPLKLTYLISEPNRERITDISDDDKTDYDTEDGHLSESFYETHAHPPQYETDQKTGDMTIPYC